MNRMVGWCAHHGNLLLSDNNKQTHKTKQNKTNTQLKVANAQASGAIAVIVVDDAAGRCDANQYDHRCVVGGDKAR